MRRVDDDGHRSVRRGKRTSARYPIRTHKLSAKLVFDVAAGTRDEKLKYTSVVDLLISL